MWSMNFTVTIPDDLHRQARIRAAEQGTTVTSVVRELLVTFCAGGESDFERRRRQRRQLLESIQGFTAEPLLTRDQLHDRTALR